MTAIETEFQPPLGVLPKDYGIFETKVLEDLMRKFNSERIRQATGDVFGIPGPLEHALVGTSVAEGDTVRWRSSMWCARSIPAWCARCIEEMTRVGRAKIRPCKGR